MNTRGERRWGSCGRPGKKAPKRGKGEENDRIDIRKKFPETVPRPAKSTTDVAVGHGCFAKQYPPPLLPRLVKREGMTMV